MKLKKSNKELIIRKINKMKQFILSHNIFYRFLMDLRNPSRILDLGCGSGSKCIMCKKFLPDVEIHGADILDNNQIPAYINYKKVNLDIELLPYPSNFFDAIIFSHVIEHLNYPLRLGGEINRVMKKGGKIYVRLKHLIGLLCLYLLSVSNESRQIHSISLTTLHI